MAKLKLFKRLIIKDKNGKIKHDSGLVPSNSFVVALLEHLYGAFGDCNISIEDTGNISRSVAEPSHYEFTAVCFRRHYIDAGANDDSFGIVVGTGTANESNTDYALATQIDHGTGSGELQYGSSSNTAPVAVGSNVDLVISRTFNNGSGGDVTVREIGVYAQSRHSSAYGQLCILRDILPSAVTVANGETLTVQYTFRTTV